MSLGLKGTSLSCFRGSRLVFKDLSFELDSGQALILRGRNGCGKSSLLRMAAGLMPPHTGALSWRGEPSSLYVGHLDGIKGVLSVIENLSFWSRLYPSQTTTSLDEALRLWGLEEQAERPALTLSQGQRHRLALSRLSVGSAWLWILDEPASGLDVASQQILQAAIDRHLSAGGAALAATHCELGFTRQSFLDVAAFSP